MYLGKRSPRTYRPETLILRFAIKNCPKCCYGNSPISAFFYPPWGVVLNCESQDIDSANKLGELALNLVSIFNTKSLIGRILYVVAAWLSESKYHVRETLPRFRESYQTALKNGDLEVVGYCDKHKSQYSYFVGQELTDL